jgi:alanine racemase
MDMAGNRPVQWMEVSGDAIDHNLALFRSIIRPESSLLAVVKANAYGHGLAEVAARAARTAQWLGVHSASEARQLRRLGLRTPILVMGCVPPVDYRDLDQDIHLVVSSEESLDWTADYRERTGTSLGIHIKVDIGTKRQGVSAEGIPGLVRRAAKLGVEVVGIAGHFANIEDTIEHDYARLQLRRFHSALDVIRGELGEDPPFIHCSCSAAALLFRETDFTLSRVGISMYGHWPSRETRLSWILEHQGDGFQLRPVLSWKATVGQLQTAETDASVGYGRTWTARRPSQLAVIPIGYADGYSRSLGNRSRVLIRGRSAPVVGRVCMNILMADVTDIPGVTIGDEVVLIGKQGDDEVQVEELASLSDTINYEFLARLSPAIPRSVV